MGEQSKNSTEALNVALVALPSCILVVLGSLKPELSQLEEYIQAQAHLFHLEPEFLQQEQQTSAQNDSFSLPQIEIQQLVNSVHSFPSLHNEDQIRSRTFTGIDSQLHDRLLLHQAEIDECVMTPLQTVSSPGECHLEECTTILESPLADEVLTRLVDVSEPFHRNKLGDPMIMFDHLLPSYQIHQNPHAIAPLHAIPATYIPKIREDIMIPSLSYPHSSFFPCLNLKDGESGSLAFIQHSAPSQPHLDLSGIQQPAPFVQQSMHESDQSIRQSIQRPIVKDIKIEPLDKFEIKSYNKQYEKDQNKSFLKENNKLLFFDSKIYTCEKCQKTYINGKNSRSIWRRHFKDKHGIKLPRGTRWDNDPNRPKNEAEKRRRMLESKRRWARRNRQERAQKKRQISVDNDQCPDIA